MGNSELEIEAKFYIGNPEKIVTRLGILGAIEVQPRTFELNLRYDTPEGELTERHNVLRLRKDRKVWLTYKGPAQPGKEVGVRKEIEIEVIGFEETQSFLKALGYQVYVRYEKYRRVFDTGGVLVMLDELPFGNFLEIEGPEVDSIRRAARQLDLTWETKCPVSYLDLFYQLKERACLAVKNLSFDEFRELKITPEMLGVIRADL